MGHSHYAFRGLNLMTCDTTQSSCVSVTFSEHCSASIAFLDLSFDDEPFSKNLEAFTLKPFSETSWERRINSIRALRCHTHMWCKPAEDFNSSGENSFSASNLTAAQERLLGLHRTEHVSESVEKVGAEFLMKTEDHCICLLLDITCTILTIAQCLCMLRPSVICNKENLKTDFVKIIFYKTESASKLAF